MRSLVVSLIAAALAMGGGVTNASAAELNIGDPAPKLDIEYFFTEPDERAKSTTFEQGQVYLVEFWATWCGPCISSMPHIAELKQTHGEKLTIFSISDEPVTRIERFLKQEVPASLLEEDGDEATDDEHDAGLTFGKLTSVYGLATDPDESVYEDYMDASGDRGIPNCYVVGKTGRIEWIGHPMAVDDVIAKVLDGTWDRETAKTQRELLVRLETLADEAQEDDADLDTLIKELDGIAAEDSGDDPRLTAMIAMYRDQFRRTQLMPSALKGDQTAQQTLLEMAGEDGQSLFGLIGDLRAASRYLEPGMKADPGFTDAVIALAREMAARPVPEDAADGDPSDSAIARLALTTMFAQRGDYAAAVEQIDELVKDPTMKSGAASLQSMRTNYQRMAEAKMKDAKKKDAEKEAEKNEAENSGAEEKAAPKS